jgi:Acetoacetate decarboxylase (ADC)
VTDRYHLVGTNEELDTSDVPTLASFNSATLKVENVSIHYCLLEIPVAQAIAMLPSGLHPCIPGMIAALHYQCPDSELGAFDLVTTAVLCRSAAKHRMMTLSAFTNSARAQTFFREGWGYQPKLADVKLAAHYDRVSSIVAVSDRVILDVQTADPISLIGPGASVRYAQTLNLAQTPLGLKLIQVDGSYDFKQSARGVPKLNIYEGAMLGDRHPKPSYPVCGTLVRADVVFGAVRYVADPYVTAETGGIGAVAEPART